MQVDSSILVACERGSKMAEYDDPLFRGAGFT